MISIITPKPAQRPLKLDAHSPTPDEIRAACQQIQREWSEEEREVRRVSTSRIHRLATDLAIDN